MPRHWKERLNREKHRDYMKGAGVGGYPIKPSKDNLILKYVYFVDVVGFTFQFSSVTQINEALKYFKQKIHTSTIQPEVFLEHYWQRWFERLPKGLLKEAKRNKIVKALEKAVAEFDRSS